MAVSMNSYQLLADILFQLTLEEKLLRPSSNLVGLSSAPVGCQEDGTIHEAAGRGAGHTGEACDQLGNDLQDGDKDIEEVMDYAGSDPISENTVEGGNHGWGEEGRRLRPHRLVHHQGECALPLERSLPQVAHCQDAAAGRGGRWRWKSCGTIWPEDGTC